jgi:GNAT superfamily N-acetyltransferase
VDQFWLRWYGHPPDGKAGFGVAPHRLYAFHRASSALAGGIHWQNPKASEGRQAGEAACALVDRVSGLTPCFLFFFVVCLCPQALARKGGKEATGGYISALAVAEGFRGRGVAKLLLAAAVEQVSLDGASASQLVVTQFGIAQTPHLDAFYHRVGFLHGPSRGLPPRPISPGGTPPPPRAGLFVLAAIPPDYAARLLVTPGGLHPKSAYDPKPYPQSTTTNGDGASCRAASQKGALATAAPTPP